MATFLTDMMKKGYTQDEVLAVLFKSEEEKKRIQMLTIVTKTVDRLEKMRELLTYEKLATFRRMNGFDRVVDREDDWRSLPPTPQEYNASLRYKLQKLKDAVSMPRKKVSNLINEIEEGKKKMAEFRRDSLDELLANFEFARVKKYVEKRSREAAQVTVTPVDTVQHCSPCPLDPEPSSSVCVRLESNVGRMDSERGELESSSAGKGLETPGQQCPPNEGIWETGRTTADGFLTAGVGSNQEGSISSPTECMDTRASTKSTATFADISSPTEHVGTLAGTAATPAKRRHKISSEENKQFDPGGKGEKAPPWNAAVTLLSFSGESWEASYLCFVFFCLCFVCVCFLNYCSFR